MIKEIPQIGMGTWLSEDKKELFETIKAGLNAGYKHIDTAQIYDNESQIGEVLEELKVNREDIFLTTKVFATNFKYHTTESINESLRRLKVEYIDLVLLHSPLTNELEAKAYNELILLRKKGIIKNIGVSNFTIDKMISLHKETGEWPYVNQIVAAPTFRNEAIEIFCKEKGIKLTGYSIMKPYFNPNPFFKDSGLLSEEKLIIDGIAKKYNRDAGQILNRWAIQLGYTIIPKSAKVSRVISNFNIFDFNLNEDEMNKINKMNRASDKDYGILINSWTKDMAEEQMKNGLLYKNNFKPGK